MCNIVSLIEKPVDFCGAPQSTEEVYNNIHIGITAINHRVPMKKMELYYYTEPYQMWTLLHTLMMFYPEVTIKKPKKAWPYDEPSIFLLKESIVSWINKLGIVFQEFSDFESLTNSLKTGEFLAKIVGKILGKDIKGITKNPKTSKVCISNIEKTLNVLEKEKNASKQYIKDPSKVYEGSSEYIMLLLEDLHRMHAGLQPRKRGKSYHLDGPFIIKPNKKEKFSLTPSRSYSNISYRSDVKSVEYKNSENSFFISRRLISNNSSAFDFYKSTPEIKPNKENLKGFEWLQKLDLKIPKNLNLWDNYIETLADGEALCNLISLLEIKDIEGVKKCKPNTPQARRNIKLAFEVLRKKPNLSSRALYIEDKVYEGDGESIRLVLLEVYKIYKNSIHNLIRFNRNYRNTSLI